MSFYEVYQVIAPYLILASIGFLAWMLASTIKEADRMFEPVEKEKNTEVHN